MVSYFQPHCCSLKDNYAACLTRSEAFDENSETDDMKPKWNYLQAEVDGVLQLIKNIWRHHAVYLAYIIILSLMWSNIWHGYTTF